MEKTRRVTQQQNEPTIDGFTKRDFIDYLRNTLIPDLRESGRDATADDFETAIKFMESAP